MAQMSLKGEPNRTYNAETIQWTVDFNMDLEDVKQAKLLDPIQEGQALKKIQLSFIVLIQS